MVCTAIGAAFAVYAAGTTWGILRQPLSKSRYPSPDAAVAEMETLVAGFGGLIHREVMGSSTQGRPILGYRFRGRETEGPRPALLVSAHLHAIEYVGSYVARAVARRLAERYGTVREVTELLDRADVWIVPQLNPDGAHRIWKNGGWTTLGGSRFTANGVDPNRNFPRAEASGRGSWNSGRNRPGSAYYRGPFPLSEPECVALARLCARERFCAAVNFHSFSAVVFMPELDAVPPDWPDTHKASQALGVFHDVFQSRQVHRRYRPVPERAASIVGQLDSFLLGAFGTVSVTVEVSWPSFEVAAPNRLLRMFSWANPSNPEYWVENDADATILALTALLERSGGSPCAAVMPELAEEVPR